MIYHLFLLYLYQENNKDMKSINYSFERSYRELSIKDAETVKNIIFNEIGMKSNTEFYLRKKNWKNIPVWCYKVICNAYQSVSYEGEIFDITEENSSE